MSTPLDVAGNPLDPFFTSIAFVGNSPVTPRSIFTDKGPIAKIPYVYFSGSGAVIEGPVTVLLPTANLNSTHVGKRLQFLAGDYAGSYLITSVLTPTRVKVQGSFIASATPITWEVYDPRDGEIADDPSDVEVSINGVQVVPEAVVGLLGQILLPSELQAGDEVKVTYSWIDNPTVEIRRLNSREFKLNGYRYDNQFAARSKHVYRYANVLPNPAKYTPTDIQANLAQPLLRGLKYRAYERAYTAALNDPNLLRLNSPIHKIAFPPMSRSVSPQFVSYTATQLPENDSWLKQGVGPATIENGDTLVVSDTSATETVFWSKSIDLTFEHVFAMTWRMSTSTSTPQGVFTGVATGYSDNSRAVVVGYLQDGSETKIGFLKAGDNPSNLSAWIGGFTSDNLATNAPITVDTSILHSYRMYQDRDGTVRLYLDGDIIESLRVTETDLPFLSDLDTPFSSLQGVFFGSLSKPALNTSRWEFVRYNILPINPYQFEAATFVSYEGDTLAEEASQPWTPLGNGGFETLLDNPTTLLLDATSASDTADTLISGGFRGFTRIEPLLSRSSNVVLDVNVQLRSQTQGITPNALMAAIDDGDRLIQLSFLSDKKAAYLSYGGRALPDWASMGTQSVEMVGHTLRITDTSASDGRVYYAEDSFSSSDDRRVLTSTVDYIAEIRTLVRSYTPDGQGFCGVQAETYDGLRSVGLLLREVAGVRYVSLHSDGVVLTQFAFEWNDSKAHTYRLVKSTGGNLVTVFVDSNFLGSFAYSSFAVPGAGPEGMFSFGSSTALSNGSQSVVDWYYANTWKKLTTKKFVGIWKGKDNETFSGYHLPLKTRGVAAINGNTLSDPNVDFVASGVATNDYLVIDDGLNKGTYTVVSVAQHTLTISGAFPSQPSNTSYRIPLEIDWSVAHRYRLVRTPVGTVALLLDEVEIPFMEIGYSAFDLPSNSIGVPRQLNGALPSISFGAFDPLNLSQSAWDFVRYGVTLAPTEDRIVPHHQRLNQRNVIASPDHLYTTIPHTHTDFWSSSTGIPSQIDPDLLRDPDLIAYTMLNEGTPLVPSTQTYEVRSPQVTQRSVSGLNRPEDVLNTDRDFVLNDGRQVKRLVVPDDVLYNALEVIETTTGETDHIAPFDDRDTFQMGTLHLQGEGCLSYDGLVLPELDTSASTPWQLASDDASHVATSVFGGVLNYGTDGTGTKTIYRNATPLPDAPGLTTEFNFRLKLANDATNGNGDSQVRFGFSAPGMTMALGFVTTTVGERYVLAIDQTNQQVVGGERFDYLDGNFHNYRIVRDPGLGLVSIFIDS